MSQSISTLKDSSNSVTSDSPAFGGASYLAPTAALMSAILEIMEQTLQLAQTNYELSATQAKQQVASAQASAAETIASGNTDANMSISDGTASALSAGANLGAAAAGLKTGSQESKDSQEHAEKLDAQQKKFGQLAESVESPATAAISDEDRVSDLTQKIENKMKINGLHTLDDAEIGHLNDPDNAELKVKVQEKLNKAIKSTKDSLQLISNKYQAISAKWDKATQFVSTLSGTSKYYTSGQQTEKSKQEAEKVQNQTVSDLSRSTLSQITQAAQDAVSRALALFQVLDKLSQSNRTNG